MNTKAISIAVVAACIMIAAAVALLQQSRERWTYTCVGTLQIDAEAKTATCVPTVKP